MSVIEVHAKPYRDGFAVRVSNKAIAIPCAPPMYGSTNSLCMFVPPPSIPFPLIPSAAFWRLQQRLSHTPWQELAESEAEERHLLLDMTRQLSVAVMSNTVTSMKARCPQMHYDTTSSIKETVLFPVTA